MITVFGDTPARISVHAERDTPKPRTLLLKLLSKREARAWQKQVAEAKRIEDVDQRDVAFEKALDQVVTGWENIPGTFSISAIADNFTMPEYMELLEEIPFAMSLRPDDLKKSASPS